MQLKNIQILSGYRMHVNARCKWAKEKGQTMWLCPLTHPAGGRNINCISVAFSKTLDTISQLTDKHQVKEALALPCSYNYRLIPYNCLGRFTYPFRFALYNQDTNITGNRWKKKTNIRKAVFNISFNLSKEYVNKPYLKAKYRKVMDN